MERRKTDLSQLEKDGELEGGKGEELKKELLRCVLNVLAIHTRKGAPHPANLDEQKPSAQCPALQKVCAVIHCRGQAEVTNAQSQSSTLR